MWGQRSGGLALATLREGACSLTGLKAAGFLKYLRLMPSSLPSTEKHPRFLRFQNSHLYRVPYSGGLFLMLPLFFYLWYVLKIGSYI